MTNTQRPAPFVPDWVFPGAKVSLRRAIGHSGITQPATIEKVTKATIILTNGTRLPLSHYNPDQDNIRVAKGINSTTISPAKEGWAVARTATERNGEALCRGCLARHHERCTGWTNQYETRSNGALALIACACPAAFHFERES